MPRSGPIGGHTRVVRGGRGRGGGHEGRGRKRPNRYDDDGSSGGSRGKFSRYEDRRDMRVSRAACTCHAMLTLATVQGQVPSGQVQGTCWERLL